MNKNSLTFDDQSRLKYQDSKYYDFTSNGDDVEVLENDPMENWEDYGAVVRKDLVVGETLKVLRFVGVNGTMFTLECEGGILVECSVKKERRFFEALTGKELDNREVAELLEDPDYVRYVFDESSEQGYTLRTETDDYGRIIGSLYQSYMDNRLEELIQEASNPNKHYNVRIISREKGGFAVDLNGFKAFLPGSLAATNKISNFDEYVGKTVPVMIEDYIDGGTFIVSNKKYVNHVLPEMVRNLDITKLYEGTVTGTGYTKAGVAFGAFIEFDTYFTGLLHTTEMIPDTLAAFKAEKLTQGSKVSFYVREVKWDDRGQPRLILSDKGPGGEIVTIEDFSSECTGTTQTGVIVGIQPFGSFIRMRHKGTDFTGLLHVKRYDKKFEPSVGKEVNVYIAKVNPEDEKIFLELVHDHQ